MGLDSSASGTQEAKRCEITRAVETGSFFGGGAMTKMLFSLCWASSVPSLNPCPRIHAPPPLPRPSYRHRQRHDSRALTCRCYRNDPIIEGLSSGAPRDRKPRLHSHLCMVRSPRIPRLLRRLPRCRHPRSGGRLLRRRTGGRLPRALLRVPVVRIRLAAPQLHHALLLLAMRVHAHADACTHGGVCVHGWAHTRTCSPSGRACAITNMCHN